MDKGKNYIVTDEGELLLSPKVTVIEADMFKGRADIKIVIIPSSVEKIEFNAFKDCFELVSVKFEPGGKNPLHIAGYAFMGCVSLREVLLPRRLEFIGNRAFCFCSVLEKIHIPANCKSMGQRVFNRCKALEEISFGSIHITTGDYVFMGCTALKVLRIGSHSYPAVTLIYEPGCVTASHFFKGRFCIRARAVYRLQNGEIIGPTGYVVRDTQGLDGTGLTLHEAWEDYEFVKSIPERQEELRAKHLTRDSYITKEDFRVMTKACKLGTDTWCKQFDIPKGKWRLGECLEKIKGLPFYQDIVNFIDNTETKKD